MAVYIDEDLCKSCKICIQNCPGNVFELSGRVNKKGYDYVAAVREENCIKCAKCEKICPDFAIHIEN